MERQQRVLYKIWKKKLSCIYRTMINRHVTPGGQV
jgi:hypothetical protein